MEDFIDRQKMKKLGTADEIAASAAFLASDEVQERIMYKLIVNILKENLGLPNPTIHFQLQLT